MRKIKYSVILPVHNEEESLDELGQRLFKVLDNLGGSSEIIFIDDGSTDRSWQKIQKPAQKSASVKAIAFRRDSGKSLVYSCGFAYSRGQILITLDSDLQDRPEEIPKLIAKLNKGYDFVSGWKVKRYDPVINVVASRVFNRLVSFLTGVKIHDFNCGLRVFRREVTANLRLHGDLYRFLPALVSWRGFQPRRYGKSKYGWSKFPKGLLDLFTVLFLLRFLVRPLHLFGTLGAFSFLIGLLVNLYLAVIWFSGESIGRRPLLILGVLLMIVGFQFVSTGLLAEMMAYFQAGPEKD